MDGKNGFSGVIKLGLTAAVLASLFLVPSTFAAKKQQTQEISQETLAQHPEITDLREQVAATPEDALLQANLGNMYARLGWDDLAIESYLGALTLDESLYEAWTNLGTIYNRQEKLPEAERSFRKAIDLQPRAALAYYNLGTVLDRADRYDEALMAYKTAITYDPDLLDPATNPQVVNNEHLTSIRLMSYLETSGSGALPLEEFTADMEAMADEMEAAEEASEEKDGSAAAVIPVAAAAAAGSSNPPSASGTSSGKPVLGTLSADIKKESRRARRKRQKQQQSPAPAGSDPATS